MSSFVPFIVSTLFNFIWTCFSFGWLQSPRIRFSWIIKIHVSSSVHKYFRHFCFYIVILDTTVLSTNILDISVLFTNILDTLVFCTNILKTPTFYTIILENVIFYSIVLKTFAFYTIILETSIFTQLF